MKNKKQVRKVTWVANMSDKQLIGRFYIPLIPYPKKYKDEWKSVKIKQADHERISHLFHVEKWKKKEIAELYHVAPITITYHLDSNYRSRSIKDSSRRQKIKMMSDPKYREHTNQNMKQWRELAYKERPELLRYEKTKMFFQTPHGLLLHKKFERKYRLKYPERTKATQRRKWNRYSDLCSFRQFWASLEPDTRTKKQIHAAQMRRWRFENPEKQKQILERWIAKQPKPRRN
jgi:hypothetical protein